MLNVCDFLCGMRIFPFPGVTDCQTWKPRSNIFTFQSQFKNTLKNNERVGLGSNLVNYGLWHGPNSLCNDTAMIRVLKIGWLGNCRLLKKERWVWTNWIRFSTCSSSESEADVVPDVLRDQRRTRWVRSSHSQPVWHLHKHTIISIITVTYYVVSQLRPESKIKRKWNRN